MITAAKPAQAGTLESSDARVTIIPAPKGQGVQVKIESIVNQQFGDVIHKIVNDFVNSTGLTDISVSVNDRGALDFVLQARLEAAFARAGKVEVD